MSILTFEKDPSEETREKFINFVSDNFLTNERKQVVLQSSKN